MKKNSDLFFSTYIPQSNNIANYLFSYYNIPNMKCINEKDKSLLLVKYKLSEANFYKKHLIRGEIFELGNNNIRSLEKIDNILKLEIIYPLGRIFIFKDFIINIYKDLAEKESEINFNKYFLNNILSIEHFEYVFELQKFVYDLRDYVISLEN